MDATELETCQRALADSERRRLKIQQLSGVGFWELNHCENTLYWSDEIFTIYSLEPGSVAPDYTIFAGLIHPDDREWVEAAFLGSVANRSPYDIRYRIKAGEAVKWIDANGITDYDAKGNPITSFGTAEDVTELVRSEQKAANAQQKAIQLEKLSTVGAMASGVAHELNNPLMGILNFAEFCLTLTEVNDPRHGVLEDIVRETRRCSGIIEDLLTFSQHEKATRAEPPTTDIDITSVIDYVRRLLAFRIDNENIAICVSAITQPIVLKISSNALQQVLINLITNAIDAMASSQHKQLSLKASVTKHSLRIEVSDTGSGIPADIETQIFDPFFTTKSPGKGTGLGLSTTWSIVNAAGGTIHCLSEAGIGTNMVVRLPLQSTVQEQQ